MKIFKKKAVITALCGLAIVSGAIGISVANAEPDNWLAISYEDKITEAFLGETVSIEGVLPVYPDKVDEIYFEVKDPDGMNVQVIEDAFSVGKVGDYRIYVCVLGYGGSVYTESYTLSATKSDAPVLTQVPVLPVAFLEGTAYELPVAIFTDYNTATPSVTEHQAYLSDKNGQNTLVTGPLMPAVSRHQDEIVLKYVAKSTVTNKENVVEYKVPVLKAIAKDSGGNITYQYDKLFLTSGAIDKTEVTENATMFYGQGSYSFSYFNKVESSFSLLLKSESGYVNFNKITVTVTDSLNEKEQISLEILQNNTNETALLRVNSGTTYLIGGSLRSEAVGLGLFYDERTQTLSDIKGNAICKIATNTKNQEISGFSSGFVTIKVAVESGTAYSALGVNYVNRQTMTSENKVDEIFPYCEPLHEPSKKNNVGATVTIYESVAYDIIDPNVTKSVSVYDPEGNILTSLDGVLLNKVPANREYQIVLNSLGEYTVHYTAQDASYNEYKAGYYTLYVLDMESPTVALYYPIKSNVEVGEKVTVPELEYSDNISEKENLTVFAVLTLPNDTYKILEIGSEYTFSLTGVYTIRYTVYDEAFNFTTVEQTIYCREAQ